MRSISSGLKSAQQSPSVKPFIHIYFTGKDEGHYDYSHRLIQLEHHEESYNDWANIFLYDNDRAIVDLRGAWIEIGYGAYVGSTVEYADTPRLWVKSTQLTSREGDLFMVLHCEGMWSHMSETDIVTKGSPPTFDGQYEESYTIYDTLKDIFNSCGFTLNPLGGVDDGIIDTLCPMVWLNQSPFENPAEVIYRLICMTKCFARPLTDLEFELVFPQDTDDEDESYSYNAPHYFHEYAEILNLVIPNHIVVYANPGEDEQWTNIIIAEAYPPEDDDSIERYKEVTKHHIAMDITNATDAENRASAILTRIMFEELSGRLIVPHDCRVELYDRVAIYDER